MGHEPLVLPRFVNESKSAFSATLRKRVHQYFRDHKVSMHANGSMVAKTVILMAMYVLPFAAIFFYNPGNWFLYTVYAVMGFSMAGIGMSIMHDANHGAYSSNANVNRVMGYALNLVGGMVYNWKMQHNVLHHNYTNISGVDDDIDDKMVCKFSPHSETKKRHKHQYIYAFLLYCVLTLYWVTLKDFVQYKRYREYGVQKNTRAQDLKNLFSTIFLKLFYFSYILILPVYVGGYSWGSVILGFVILHAICGLILSVVFQLAHCVDETSYPLPNAENKIMEDWAIHQMRTTMNFARESKLISWYVGGLNFQVEHHLFPSICHVHYPAISKIVEETAKEYEVPYLCTRTFGEALRSHIRVLKKFGYKPEFDIAAM
ncbi:MAG: fatty acid desaturase family protein [Flavobacteriales bacterium]